MGRFIFHCVLAIVNCSIAVFALTALFEGGLDHLPARESPEATGGAVIVCFIAYILANAWLALRAIPTSQETDHAE